jgi:phage gp36-like protein
MSYVTIDDITQAVDPEWLLTVADPGRTGTPDVQLLAAAVASAQAHIDAMLHARYRLPAAGAPVPAALRDIALALALEALRMQQPGCALPEGMQGIATVKRSLLEALAAGRASLPDLPARRAVIVHPAPTSRPRPLRDGGSDAY